jgi:hypothetical protein
MHCEGVVVSPQKRAAQQGDKADVFNFVVELQRLFSAAYLGR